MKPADSLAAFHPEIRSWFAETLGEPTPPQVRGWPLIRAGKNVLIAAPTGSGKTLAAFLSCIDELLHDSERGPLPDETRILYVSPLKALGNDIQKNLIGPLEALHARVVATGAPAPHIRVGLRTGDTTPAERERLVTRPPHILITTPESLYLYLTSARARATLTTVRTVVVDEVHALARDKRGSHFALSMERLRALCPVPLRTIGISATVRPLDAIARYLTGARTGDEGACEVVEVGHARDFELTIETPDEELSAVASHEMWGQVYDRLVALSAQHRTMLVFTNTRRLSERMAHDLGLRLGVELVAAHHGSMAKEPRLLAEQRLKAGSLKVLVATASLELGIDIGSIDLVVQIGSPRNIAVMLQRLGRAGHHKSLVSKGIIFAFTRDELVECAALVWAIRKGELDAIRMPVAPLDVLAQQIVAEVAATEWDEAALRDRYMCATPYTALKPEAFEAVVAMASDGAARGRAHLHRDRVHGVLRPRKGARLTAVQNGGAIADLFSYPVIVEPEGKQVGTVDEDFAVESMAGDIFLLGTTSWRVRQVAGGTVRVENANGQAPTVPFWRGEAPARTDELSARVSALRETVVTSAAPERFLESEVGLAPKDATAVVRYLKAAAVSLGAAPTQARVIAERFFDEAGGMHVVIHAPFGARVNRAWGMALRKCFCRAFDFELQAAASDDGILLSLGEQHSFPLMDIFSFVASAKAEKALVQAVLQAPLFGTRFRWAAGRALSLTRQMGGRRVPPAIQRARSEDLLAFVFPEQVGCQDNHGGMELEPPDHPLVNEAMTDCLRDFMDVDRLVQILEALKRGEIEARAVDLPEPSVLAHQMLNSQPYTFLDDAPLEERRARAVSVRRTLPASDAAELGALDADAIATVTRDAAPVIRDAEELHDALLSLGVWPVEPEWASYLAPLMAARRAGVLTVTGRDVAYAAERVPVVAALWPDARLELAALPGDAPVAAEQAAIAVVGGWIEVVGITTATELGFQLGLSASAAEQALCRLEMRGSVLRGRFRPGRSADAQTEWCDRRLLQRIHRLTVGRLRREIEPLTAQDFMRFLFRWHHADGEGKLRGPGGLAKAVRLLQGYEAPASSWEADLLPARMKGYQGELLSQACFAGDVAWGRLTVRAPAVAGPHRGQQVATRSSMTRSAQLSFVMRRELDWMLEAARAPLDDGERHEPPGAPSCAEDVLAVLQRRGASFFNELVSATRRLPAEVEDALWELVARGRVSGDAVENLRVLQSAKARKRQRQMMRGGPGRWTLFTCERRHADDELDEKRARLFLDRYGIVFRDLAMREPLGVPWIRLARVYRRLEARGELRGGRFVAGLTGEQFALKEAVDLSRVVRRSPLSGDTVRIAATDPLNLTGIVTPGARIPAIPWQYVCYVDGVPTPTDDEQLIAGDDSALVAESVELSGTVVS